MPQKTDRAAAIYSRKSKFTGKGESVENQTVLCRQYIVSRFGEKAAENVLIYEDEGFSGGNTDRPRFRQMMSDAKDGKISAVVCYRLDRVSRNISDFAELIRELEKLGVSFVSVREDFDTSSPMGRAMMYIASVFSQLERETIAERIRDNMRELAKTGRWLGGTTPTGYRSESAEYISADGRTKRACRLAVIESEAETVRLIFSKFLETGSLTKTDEFLLRNRVTTKNGRDFTRFAIKNILSNPVYMTADETAYGYLSERGAEVCSDRSAFDGKYGVSAYDRTEQKRGKTNKVRDISEWIIAVGKHRPIIKSEDWIKARAYLERNRSAGYGKTRSSTALLSGILFCGKCGGYMRPKLTQRTDKNGERVYTYMCSTKERSRSGICDMPNISGNMLDRAVCGEIKKLPADRAEFIKLLDKAEKDILSESGCTDDEADRLNALIYENGKAISELTKTLSGNSGSSAAEYIIKEIERLHSENLVHRSRLKELENARGGHSLTDEGGYETVKDTVSSFGRIFDIMTTEQKRSVLRACVRKIILGSDGIRIYLYGSDETEENGTYRVPLCEDSK